MKNKLSVMFFTFIVMIALTPLIFGKLMNAKFNQILDGFRHRGIKITLIKDKSSYLKTDKVFKAQIPASLLGYGEIAKRFDFIIETEFKNLPVTNVFFKGKVEKIELTDAFKDIQKDINGYIKDKINFYVTTPNFKDYAYTIDGFETNKSMIFKVSRIKGALSVKNGVVQNKMGLNKVSLRDGKKYIELKNIKVDNKIVKNSSVSTTTFNLYSNALGMKLQVKNITLTSNVFIKKLAKLTAEASFDKFALQNMLESEKFFISLSVNGIKSKLLQKLASKPSSNDEIIEKIFENGFSFNINSGVKDINFTKLNKDLGDYKLKIGVQFKPVKNINQKLNNRDVSFVDAKIDFDSSVEIATVLMQLFPRSAFVFAFAQKKNGRMHLNLELKNGKLYSNNREVK